MHINEDKLHSCIKSMKQHFTKSSVDLIGNRVYKIFDYYIVYNKSKKSLELDCVSDLICSNAKYIFSCSLPKSISTLNIQIVDNLPEVSKNLNNEVVISETPKKLLEELSNTEYVINHEKFMFSVPIPELIDDLKLVQEHNNVKIMYKYEVMRTIMDAELRSNKILCNSWSVTKEIIEMAVKKYDNIENTARQILRNQMMSNYRDIMDNLVHYSEKIDNQVLSQAFKKIVLDIQKGKYNK